MAELYPIAMDQDRVDRKIEWYTLPNRLVVVGALAFIYAYWDRIPEKTTVLLMFAGFFLIPMLAAEVAFHVYFRKCQGQRER